MGVGVAEREEAVDIMTELRAQVLGEKGFQLRVGQRVGHYDADGRRAGVSAKSGVVEPHSRAGQNGRGQGEDNPQGRA